MKEFILFIILFLNLVKFITVLFVFKRYIPHKNNIALKLINFFLLFQILTTGILVSLIRIFTGAKISVSFGVSHLELFKVEFLEFISFGIFITIIFLLIKTSLLKITHTNVINRKSYFFLIFINIICFLNYFNSDFENKLLFTEALKYLSGPSAVLLLFFSLKLKNSKIIIFLSIIHLLLFLFLVLSTGVRGPIVGIVLIFIFLNYNYNDFNVFRKKMIILLIPIFLLIFVNNEYSKIKTAFASAYISNPSAYQNIGDISLFIIDYIKSDSKDIIEGNDSKIFEEFEFRFGARSMFSVGFHRFVNNHGFTLLKPITNTLFVFFPRIYFNQDKPYPDSYNGEINGMGMYVCVNEIDGSGNMSDFYPSSHYFWEFGLIGVLFFTVLSSLYIVFVIKLIHNKDIIYSLLLVLFALKPYYFMPQFTLSDIIIMIVTKISLFLILYTFFSLTYNVLSRKSYKNHIYFSN